MKIIEITNYTATTLQPIPAEPPLGEFDVVARIVRTNASNSTQIQAMQTATLVSQFDFIKTEWQADVSALNKVIEWQHKIIDLNSSYTALLLEQISEQEFESIAEAMANEEIDLSEEEISPIAERILKLTTIGLTASDLANLLSCSQEKVARALRGSTLYLPETPYTLDAQK